MKEAASEMCHTTMTEIITNCSHGCTLSSSPQHLDAGLSTCELEGKVTDGASNDEQHLLIYDKVQAEEAHRCWRESIDSLQLELALGGLHGASKCQLTELSNLLQASAGKPQCCLHTHGDRPILVTAPHSLYVLRDSHPPHKKELYTA